MMPNLFKMKLKTLMLRQNNLQRMVKMLIIKLLKSLLRIKTIVI
jgi:hypothetical protein